MKFSGRLWLSLPIYITGLVITATQPAVATSFPKFPGAPNLFGKAVVAPRAAIEAVVISPLFNRRFTCVDHPEGEVTELGDALGTDCLILGGFADKDSGYFRLFKSDGKHNPDWYGWHAPVLSPMNAEVVGIYRNPVTNTPGHLQPALPSFIVFKRSDDVIVVYAHVADIRVKIGDHVTAGQIVALDGNNGFARAPHIHVGAYRGVTPLQIRWDQRAEQKIFENE